MGLDITAYSHLKYVRPGELTEEEMDTKHDEMIDVFAYAGFEHATRGLVNHNITTKRHNTTFIAESVYATTPETETHGFRAGSYSGFGAFRRDLADFAGYPATEASEGKHADEPFYELVNFADNEGSIGPESAADLLADFRDHRDKFIAYHAADVYGYAVELYDDWTRACELAADGGIIRFH